ncbi:MAG: thioredoxin fold domain-containing protein [Myxococcota bacterium]
MWLLTVASLAVAAEEAPAVSLVWHRGEAELVVAPPAGSKVAHEAPGHVSLTSGARWLELDADGALLEGGVSVGDVRGTSLAGELEVSLCDLAGTRCQQTRWALQVDVPARGRGRTAVAVRVPEGPRKPFGPDATADAASAAFERAKASGKPVLLDFSAVWCPPCNQLAEEVLDAGLPELDAYEVAVVDGDHPSSFALKDRYHVGGYPTVLVVAADGTERTRTVGFVSRDSFLGWLDGAATATDSAELELDPAELGTDRAAELAWILVQRGESERAETMVARAEASPASEDLVDLRLARLAVRPGRADLEWLLAHAPERAPDFALYAPSANAPEVAHDAVAAALRQARGADVAVGLEVAGELAPDPATAQLFEAAAAGVVASQTTGDAVHDKPYLGWLAHALEDSGDPAAARGLLEAALPRYPDEPTVDLALAPLLLRIGDLEAAEASARRAVAASWGDNRLRAAATLAKVLKAAGKDDEARQVAQAELDAQDDPSEAVRTHRYREALEALAGGAPTQ